MEFKKKSQLADEFRAEFNVAKSKIETDTCDLDQVPSTDIKEKISSIDLAIHDLKIKLQEANKFLPAYTAKARQDDIKALEEALQQKEELLNPKPKFSFKGKKPSRDSDAAKKSPTKSDKQPEVAQESPATTFDIRNDPNFLTIQNDTIESGKLTNNIFTFEQDKLNKIDVMVRDLDGKEICLFGSPSTLHLSNLTNCKLLCGPVQTSVFVDNCKNCSLYVCCQQLRTHNSSDLDIYLRVSSRGIIENCSKIRFAPYEWKHPDSAKLHEMANINEDLQRFDAIDDFNWLAFTTPSPNWSVLPDNERKYFP